MVNMRLSSDDERCSISHCLRFRLTQIRCRYSRLRELFFDDLCAQDRMITDHSQILLCVPISSLAFLAVALSNTQLHSIPQLIAQSMTILKAFTSQCNGHNWSHRRCTASLRWFCRAVKDRDRYSERALTRR